MPNPAASLGNDLVMGRQLVVSSDETLVSEGKCRDMIVSLTIRVPDIEVYVEAPFSVGCTVCV